MKLLVSVRDVAEARLAAGGGADFIDLKEPSRGALGGLPVETVREIVAALRGAGHAAPISATIGDWPADDLAAIGARVDAVGACGVDYVKVGIERSPAALALLDALAASAWPVIPVFIADAGLDDAAVRHAAALGFPGLMVDTADKRAGSVFDLLPLAALAQFIATVRAGGGRGPNGTHGAKGSHGRDGMDGPDDNAGTGVAAQAIAGIAGALRLAHLPWLVRLAPDFAGFRTAVCHGDRSGRLDGRLLQALAAALAGRREGVADGSGAVAVAEDEPVLGAEPAPHAVRPRPT